MASFTAFTYAELSSRFPVAAGVAVYLQEGFGESLVIRDLRSGDRDGGHVYPLQRSLRALPVMHRCFLTLPDEIIVGIILAILVLIAIWGVSESVMTAAFSNPVGNHRSADYHYIGLWTSGQDP